MKVTKQSKYPEYCKAITAFRNEKPRDFERYRKSNELTYMEKRLLEIRSLFKKHQWTEALELALSISEGPCAFLNGELYSVRGYLYSFFEDRRNAILCNKLAAENYNKFGEDRGEFVALYNMATYSMEISDLETSKEGIDKAWNLANNAYNNSAMHKIQAFYFLHLKKQAEAQVQINKAFEYWEALSQREKGVLLTAAANFFFRLGDLKKCREQLEVAQSNKMNDLRGWCLFHLKLLDAIESNAKLSRMPQAVQLSQQYRSKWLALEGLQEGDLNQATEAWAQLQKNSPTIFGPNFTCLTEWDKGDIFFKAIEKYTQSETLSSPVKKIFSENLPPKGTLLEKLLNILTQATHPLRKEDLIEKVWDTEYDPKYDNNFYQLIKTLKSTYDIPISNQHRAYILKKFKN